MSLRILVTGSEGFTGRHLIEFLKKNTSHQLFCSTSKSDGDNLCCDLRDDQAAFKLLEETKPDQIYHLAGSFTQDYEIDYAANVVSTRNILEATLKLNLKARILLVGSAAEYGAIRPEDNPVKETQPLNPASVYGLTKVFQTNLMSYYRTRHNMDIVMARTFNLVGQGLSPNLFVGRLFEQMDAFKRGEQTFIELGCLDDYRDYIPVEEAVMDYAGIMDFGETGAVYHVASGKPVLMRNLLKQILEEESVPFDKIKEDTGRNPGKFNVPSIYADISKIKSICARKASCE